MRTLLAASLLVLAVANAASAPDDFRWAGSIARGKAIEIKGVSGNVRAENTSGNQAT